MFLLRKSVLSYGAVAVAAGILILAAPRAAHAIAATLVQVTNTAANPAITQGIGQQAAPLVNLLAYGPGGTMFYPISPLGNINFSGPYIVPAGQTLVITSVDVSPIGCTGATEVDLTSSASGLTTWYVNGSSTTQFQYPTGIPMGAGGVPTIYQPTCNVRVGLHGYLTSN